MKQKNGLRCALFVHGIGIQHIKTKGPLVMITR